MLLNPSRALALLSNDQRSKTYMDASTWALDCKWIRRCVLSLFLALSVGSCHVIERYLEIISSCIELTLFAASTYRGQRLVIQSLFPISIMKLSVASPSVFLVNSFVLRTQGSI